MDETFTPEFFRNNRLRLRALFTGTAPIIMTANGLLQRSGDSTYPFRQDSSFWYLTGITEPDVLLVMDKTKEYLIVPSRSASREAFDGSVSFETLSATAGIEDVVDDKEGWKRLTSRLKRVQNVATLAAAPAYIETHGMYVNPARRRLIRRLRTESASLEVLDLRQHMTKMRMVKQAPEIAALRRAVEATCSTFEHIKQNIASYRYEYEIEAEMTAMFRKHGHNHAYAPIIASGKNACTLHYMSNNDGIAEGGLVLLDVGAEADGYAADISRTYAAAEPNKRQQQVWQAVMDVQEFAFEAVRPGVVIGEYEKSIEAFMGEKLRELGLIKTIEHESVRRYYPHATSHFLGLDVHDAADYERPLEPGMILTVEPGIYIPEESIGIRIEDDVLITDTGIEVLSASLDRRL